MIDVAPYQLKIINATLQKHVPYCEVRAFGSRVTWTAKDYSDLDLAIVGKKKLADKILYALKEDFEESDLPFRVDVLDWNSISDEFRRVINKGYEVLQESKTKFKETELGKIPEDWEETSLGSIVTFQRGFDLPLKKKEDGHYPIIMSNGIGGYHNEFKAKGPGVTIGRSGNLGEPFYIEKDYWPHNTTLYIKKYNNAYPKFVYYFLKGLKLSRFNAGSAVPTLNRNHIHPIPIIFPKRVDEQKAIAKILSDLDSKIELNNQTNKTLEAIGQALFKRWFIDFEFPDENGEPYKSSGGEMVASELGEIPKNWSISNTGKLLTVKGGTTPSTKNVEYWENGSIAWCTPKDLSKLSSPVLLDTKRKITEAGLATISSGFLPVGTLLLSSRAPIGYVAISEIPVSVNQGFIAIIPAKQISNFFILYWIKRNLAIIKNMAGGSTFQEINKTSFREIKMLLPNSDTLNSFNKIIKIIHEKIVINQKESHVLSNICDSLLPRLMSGRIRVAIESGDINEQ